MAPRRTLHERIVEAETKSARALGNFHEAEARGKTAAAERYLETSQRWLDIANDLRAREGT
jgi:hypothetical protein